MPKPTIVPDYNPTSDDARREKNMTLALQDYESAENKSAKQYYWMKYKKLHASRSPEWVAWDEKRKGLRK